MCTYRTITQLQHKLFYANAFREKMPHRWQKGMLYRPEVHHQNLRLGNTLDVVYKCLVLLYTLQK